MAAHFKDSDFLTFPVYRAIKMFAAGIQPFGNGWRGECFPGIKVVLYLAEYPWITDSSAADHNAIYPIPVLVFEGFFRTVYISIAKDGYVYAGVFLDLSNKCPVGISFV